MRRALWVLALLPACLGTEPSGPGPAVQIGQADLRVLFIGNSLTRSNDLPVMVGALAALDGRSFAYGTLASPGWSLEEHWGAGVADVIASERPDVVVMQQGPSSLPASRDHLVHWSSRLATVIRAAGGEPALFMVWPSEDRLAFFGDVRDAYRAAAEAVDGLFIPAGVTWLEAWERDDDFPLYGPDRFHPSALGSLAAALTIYASLFGLDGDGLPAPEGGVTAEQLVLLREAVTASMAR